MPYVLNTETAKIAAAKSAEARKRYAAERKQTSMLIELQTEHNVAEALAEQPKDPLEAKFARALEKTLDDFLASPDATERAKNARSMREVRETYHLWSGQPKPGTIKPTSNRPRQQSRDLPDGPSTGE